MSHHKWTLGLLQFHARRSSKSYAYQPRPETAARIMNSSPADVRPTARGVAERPQHEPDPWHDRRAHFLAGALDLCELVPVQASRPYPYGVAGALAGVEVVFGSRPGRFI